MSRDWQQSNVVIPSWHPRGRWCRRSRKPYPSDRSAVQWERVAPLIPPAKPGGSPRRVDMREVRGGIVYLTRAGMAWRALPHDLPYVGTCSW